MNLIIVVIPKAEPAAAESHDSSDTWIEVGPKQKTVVTRSVRRYVPAAHSFIFRLSVSHLLSANCFGANSAL
jgi:hypothetical protein